MSARNWMRISLGGLAAAAALSACTTPAAAPPTPAVTAKGSPTSTATAHNAADTMFAQMMILHHQGAIEMADLAVEKAQAPEVKALAQNISAAQGPEIETMTNWLTSWGENPSPSPSGMPSMGHPGMDMHGMSQEEVMAQLEGLTGTEFDRQFLTSMIAHHEGAVTMAQTELAQGKNPDALALAQKIINDQQAEIVKMTDMHASL